MLEAAKYPSKVPVFVCKSSISIYSAWPLANVVSSVIFDPALFSGYF